MRNTATLVPSVMVAVGTAALLIAVVAAGLIASAPAAGAASSVRAGWWTAAPVATAPDAPSDGLVVRGGLDPEQPEAYAAVEFLLAPGEHVSIVRLTVAPNSLSTPEADLVLCALRESFTPAHGGSMDAAPAFDCTTSVTGSLSPDGTRYAFDVSGFPQDGALAGAVVPSSSTDRVVFEWPGLDALTFARTISGGLEPPSAPGNQAATTSAPDVVPGGTPSAPLPAPVIHTPSPAAGFESATPSTPDAGEQPAEMADVAAPPLAAASDVTSGAGSTVAALVFAGLALLGAGLWAFAGREPVEEPASSF